MLTWLGSSNEYDCQQFQIETFLIDVLFAVNFQQTKILDRQRQVLQVESIP